MPKPGGCHPSGSSLGDARSRLAWLEYACGANVLGRKLLAGQTAGQRLGNKAHSAGAMWALRAPDFDNRLARTRGATLAARRNAERQPAEKDRGGVPAPIASRSLADLRQLREASASELLMTCRKRFRRCQNRGVAIPLGSAWGMCPETAQAASGMEAARSSIWLLYGT